MNQVTSQIPADVWGRLNHCLLKDDHPGAKFIKINLPEIRRLIDIDKAGYLITTEDSRKNDDWNAVAGGTLSSCILQLNFFYITPKARGFTDVFYKLMVEVGRLAQLNGCLMVEVFCPEGIGFDSAHGFLSQMTPGVRKINTPDGQSILSYVVGIDTWRINFTQD